MKNLILFVLILGTVGFSQSVLVVDQYGGGQYITINAALTAAVAGDTIKVMPGLYQEQIILTKKVHFLAMDTTAILDYQTNYTFYFNTGSTGASLQGFNIRKPITAASGVKDILIASNIFDSTSVTLGMGAGSAYFMNNLLRNTTLNASNSSEKIVVFNNKFVHTSTTGTILTVSGGNVVVSNNEFWGGGTAISAGYYCNLIANKIYNPATSGITFSHVGNIKIISNQITNAGQQGIQGVFTNGTNGQSFTNIVLSNNLIKGSSINGGIYFVGYHQPGSSIKTLNSSVTNNVVYGTGRGIYVSGYWTTTTLFEIKNNILSNNTYEAVTTSYGIMSTDFNCTFSNGTNTLTGVGNLLSTNPLFVNATSGDFTLQSGSSCINTGSPVPQNYDLDRTRNDMGIYGGSYNWDNMHAGAENSKVLELLLSPVATAQGNTITITGSGVANKTLQNTSQSNQNNSNTTK